MNKLFLLGTVLTAGVVLVGCNQQTPPATTTIEAPVQNVVITDNNDQAPDTLIASSNYISYSPEALKDVQKKDATTAVFFHSKTCGSCKKLDENLVENDETIPDDLVILKTDWDENQELAKELGVDTYHTVAFMNADGTSDNVKGLFTLNELIAAGETAMKDDAPSEEVIISNSYKEYSELAYKDADAQQKDVAIFFHSKTCGSCKKLDDNLTASLTDIPEGTVILKADWDENQELAKELGVDTYHTVAFMNTDGTSKNVKGLFTLSDVLSAQKLPNN